MAGGKSLTRIRRARRLALILGSLLATLLVLAERRCGRSDHGTVPAAAPAAAPNR
ncbi:MAG TPA: hypothetical protein VGP93_18630 [Polyangiaceae bacterium]|nr:hypothetical protein [Polyangiaceae bacterium]